MRDPKRIDEFCNELANLWHQVPDWRFGQLMENMLGARLTAVPKGVNGFFYTEDEELMNFFKNYIKEITKDGKRKNW